MDSADQGASLRVENGGRAPAVIYCASVSPNLRCVSANVRRTPASVSDNLRRKWPSIARRTVYYCASLQLAQQYDVHPNQITAWKAQVLDGAVELFGGGAAEAAPAVDLKVLHAKIGELTLENDFLAGALSKAGLLSAKR